MSRKQSVDAMVRLRSAAFELAITLPPRVLQSGVGRFMHVLIWNVSSNLLFVIYFISTVGGIVETETRSRMVRKHHRNVDSVQRIYIFIWLKS